MHVFVTREVEVRTDQGDVDTQVRPHPIQAVGGQHHRLGQGVLADHLLSSKKCLSKGRVAFKTPGPAISLKSTSFGGGVVVGSAKLQAPSAPTAPGGAIRVDSISL